MAMQPPIMFSPNVEQQETEQQRAMRLQAEQLAAMSASDAEVASAQKQYDQADALRSGAGPKGRSVGSRNTFVAASPLEHMAHVWASKIRGDTADEKNAVLEEKLGKNRAMKAKAQVEKDDIARRKAEVQETNSANLGDYYKNLSETSQKKVDNDVLKIEETERHNREMELQEAAKIEAKDNEFAKTTAGERKTITDKGTAIRMVKNSGQGFKDSYARGLGGLPVVSSMAGEMLTKSGFTGSEVDAAANMLPGVSGGVGGENLEDGVRWLARWKQGYTLANRNDLFGATLTPSEQVAWDMAGEINLNMEADEIRKRVQQAEEILATKMLDGYGTGMAAEQNPALWENAMPGITDMYGQRIDQERAAAMEAATGQAAAGGMPQVQQPGMAQPPVVPQQKVIKWGEY